MCGESVTLIQYDTLSQSRINYFLVPKKSIDNVDCSEF